MGFLEHGVPLSWEESKPFRQKVKSDGLKQLLHIWNLNKSREDHDLKWGDELEFQLVHFDHANKTAKLCIDGPALLAELVEKERKTEWGDKGLLLDTMSLVSGRKSAILRDAEWHPEFGCHMIESTPNPPFDLSVESLLDIEESMMSRRLKLQSILPENTYVASMTAFPRFGLGDFMWSRSEKSVTSSASTHQPSTAYVNTPTHHQLSVDRNLIDHLGTPRALINPHPRFPTLLSNIEKRRKRKIDVLLPVMADMHTNDSHIWNKSISVEDAEALLSSDKNLEVTAAANNTANPVHSRIYFNDFGFGMSLSCLQVTFGAPNIRSARNLYDQLAILAPIFLALSAATPFLRGFVSGLDTRWKVLEGTCDSRTKEEQSTHRSRYGGISLYIGQDDFFKAHEDELNDLPIQVNEDAYAFLTQNKMDRVLARHFAFLWAQDPLVIFSDKIDLDNSANVDHFENIQSTNWNSVRFKPPPPSHDRKRPSPIGWRVELRTPDIQLSDFENSALCCFASLLTLAVLRHNFNFYIPMSKCDENLEISHSSGAITKRCFWFRHDVGKNEMPTNADSDRAMTPLSTLYSKMTLREIFLGCRRTGMVGLIPLLDQVVSTEWRHQRCSRDAVEKYRLYANYIRQRVLGQAWTDAKLLRHIALTSAAYEGNSQVSEELNYIVCKHAVMGGFSLQPEISPWNLPGCVPSSTRLPVRLNCCHHLKSFPPIRALAKLPEVDCHQQTMAFFAEENRQNDAADHDDEDRSSEHSFETRSCGTSYRGPCNCHDALPMPLTPADISHQEFDAELFLQMDQYSH